MKFEVGENGRNPEENLLRFRFICHKLAWSDRVLIENLTIWMNLNSWNLHKNRTEFSVSSKTAAIISKST